MMFQSIFSGAPGYNFEHDAFVFLGRDFKDRIHYCAASKAAVAKIAQSLGIRPEWPNESTYRSYELERVLLEHRAVIENAAAHKVANKDYTPKGAIFIREPDIFVN